MQQINPVPNVHKMPGVACNAEGVNGLSLAEILSYTDLGCINDFRRAFSFA